MEWMVEHFFIDSHIRLWLSFSTHCLWSLHTDYCSSGCLMDLRIRSGSVAFSNYN